MSVPGERWESTGRLPRRFAPRNDVEVWRLAANIPGALLTYILNLFDLAFTLYALYHGGQELNPLLQSVPLMIVYKVVILGALLGWLESRPERVARWGLRACAAVSGAVVLWHVCNLAAVVA